MDQKAAGKLTAVPGDPEKRQSMEENFDLERKGVLLPALHCLEWAPSDRPDQGGMVDSVPVVV